MVDRPVTQDSSSDDDVRRIREIFAELEVAFAEHDAFTPEWVPTIRPENLDEADGSAPPPCRWPSGVA